MLIDDFSKSNDDSVTGVDVPSATLPKSLAQQPAKPKPPAIKDSGETPAHIDTISGWRG